MENGVSVGAFEPIFQESKLIKAIAGAVLECRLAKI
jgi:hypothetical protein